MMQSSLAFENTPPLWLPCSFFLAAPCWLMFFAFLACGLTPDQVSGSPLTVALTHTLALGVLGNIMIGALFQVLSVLSGISCPHPRRWLHAIFWPLQLGCGVLVSAFLSGFARLLLNVGGALLAIALLSFSLCFSLAAFKSPARDPSTQGIRLALIGLALSAGLGWTLTAIFGRGWPLDFSVWLPHHILWASNGWLLMLLMSVALTVVPMFQITAPYPRLLRQWLPLVLFLAVLSHQHVLVALAAATFMLATLKLEWQSRRRHDISRRFWLLAMSLGLVSLLLWALLLLWPQQMNQDLCWRLIGWLWLAGVGLGSVCAMLYKIVPFLIWLQLKTSRPPAGALPSMHSFIAETAMRHGLWSYGAWVACGVLACVFPSQGRWLLTASSLTLGSLLLLHIGHALLRARKLQRGWS